MKTLDDYGRSSLPEAAGLTAPARRRSSFVALLRLGDGDVTRSVGTGAAHLNRCQSWEHVPLAPFSSKSFVTSIWPWIVPLDALAPLRAEGPKQELRPLSYLRYTGKTTIDIQLEACLKPEGKSATTVCRTNFKHVYWSMVQQLEATRCPAQHSHRRPGGLAALAGQRPTHEAVCSNWSGTGPSR